MMKAYPYVTFLLFLFSFSIQASDFHLVCETNEAVNQAKYHFDTELKLVSKVGDFTGHVYSSQTPYVFNTIGWNLEQDRLIWVTSPFTSSNAVQQFDLIVFDLEKMYVTYSSMARRGGLLGHVLEYTKTCRQE